MTDPSDTLVLAPNPQWDAEDEISGVLSDDEAIAADPEQAARMFAASTIVLPQALDWTELIAYVRRKSDGNFEVPGNADRYNFYSAEIPITTLVGDGQKLVRLSLELTFSAGGAIADDVVAFDLFPTTDFDAHTIASGEASLDIAEGLRFLMLATPAAALAPATKCLGLKLSLPFKWTTEDPKVRSSARMTNPTTWYVYDEAIRTGFSPRVIVRAPKGIQVTVDATMSGDLRDRSILGTTLKAQWRIFKPRSYVLE